MQQLSRALDNLFEIIDDLISQNKLLSDIVYFLLKGGSNMSQVNVIYNSSEIKNIPHYLSKHDCDYLILITPGQMHAALDREEIDRISEQGNLDQWIRFYWTNKTIAILV